MAVENIELKTVETESEIYIQVDSTIKKNVNKELAIFEANVKLISDELLMNIQKYVNNNISMSKIRLIEHLERKQRNVIDEFAMFKRDTWQQERILSYRIQQVIADTGINDDMGYDKNTLYAWQAVFIRTCSDCIALHGTVHTMQGWDAVGHRPKDGNTICGFHCQCVLVPAEVMPTRAEMRKPIMIQADRIRRVEKLRGKKYSSGYKSAILGNMNLKEFRKTMRDLRKVKKVKGV